MDSWMWILLLAGGAAVGTGVYFAMAKKQPEAPDEKDIPIESPYSAPAVIDYSKELISKKKGAPSKLDKLVKNPVKYPMPNYSMSNIQQPAPSPTVPYQWNKLDLSSAFQSTSPLPPSQQNFSLPASAYLNTPLTVPTNATL